MPRNIKQILLEAARTDKIPESEIYETRQGIEERRRIFDKQVYNTWYDLKSAFVGI